MLGDLALQVFGNVGDEGLVVEHDVFLQDAGIAKDIVHATASDAIVGGAESVFCIHLQWGVAFCLVVENLHLGDACLAYGLGVEIETETGNLRELTVLHGRIGCGGNKEFEEL